MKKVMLFAFDGDVMCFIHVLLNALEMKQKGYDVSIVVEGGACSVIPVVAAPDHFMNTLYDKAKNEDLFAGACRACSVKQGVDKALAAEGMELLGDMQGHPSMSNYLEKGYEIITF